MNKKTLIKIYEEFNECIGCDRDLNPKKEYNALSRYKWGYICTNCGKLEAFYGDFISVIYNINIEKKF